jgi:hypothetical protein
LATVERNLWPLMRTITVGRWRPSKCAGTSSGTGRKVAVRPVCSTVVRNAATPVA